MHPRISINTLCIQAPGFAQNVDAVARIGAALITPGIEEVRDHGVPSAAMLLRDVGLTAAGLTHRAFGFSTGQEARDAVERLNQSIDIAAGIGATSVILTTGGRGALTWHDAAARFADAIGPCAEHARRSGVALAVEPTSHLYADASIAHRLSDLVQLCNRADIGLCIDLFACWFDSDIEPAITAAAPRCQIVQLSDYVAGDRGLPCRAIPGDGMAQVERLTHHMLAAGYRGVFDLEVIGPRIITEGPEPALRRGIERLSAYLNGAVIDAALTRN